MSISITFNDTLRAVKHLEEQGLEAKAAEAIVDTVKSATLSSEPATQGDILRLQADLKATENRIIIWMVTLQIAMGGLLIASGLLG